jgi:hypothetical protein
MQESRWNQAAFLIFPAAEMAGEYPAGLLDIGGALC